ncbi:SWIM zinc finger family protein [Thermoflavimicrobium daqui]|uniref:SWIM-type domain-containing protein n=1 Tax=Thermoflavimicrobium daqui TaxID=2137476 RepID=A0A364K2B1_9BACL|nr:SWIM zinc finger family protein [Thermoflavimicrobium daqui]RAL22063.1 hypothetical protein DL897_14810 [Thermoflavimicrobium daqui]
MLFQQTYAKPSGIKHIQGQTLVDFAPDISREPTFFRGKIADPIRYRDAMIALRDVVVSDLNYKPRDHSAYQAWVQEQYLLDIADVLEAHQQVADRMKEIVLRIRELDRLRDIRNADFFKARSRYFNWLWENDKPGWYVLDPVITVAPDQVFFEAFSLDESSYGRLAVHDRLFSDVKEFQYGTTNIDFSDSLLGALKRIRTYRPTEFQIDPSGFEVATAGHEVYKEQKIDVPESWVRGFLQVQSAMNLPTVSFEMKPIHLYNLCLFLRQHREKQGPRSLRFILKPGESVKVVMEPWSEELVLSGSIYQGTEAREIRTWGRRRLFLLERLLPLANKITVHLLGTGLPSFYIVDMGALSFTLGLSGWTRNDWAAAGNFDLMVGQSKEVTPEQSTQVFDQLKHKKTTSLGELVSWTKLSDEVVQGALRQLCSAGRVMFDLEIGKYRLRELTKDPLPMDQLMYANPREEKAKELIETEKVIVQKIESIEKGISLSGEVHGQSIQITPSVELDEDRRIKNANCNCFFFRRNRLTQGPCEHILSLITLFDRTHRQ